MTAAAARINQQPECPAARVPGVKTIRNQLRSALGAIEADKPTPAEIRAAHLKAIKAVAGLDAQIARLALVDADGHRKHAIRTAKNTKDARGRRRAPVTMPGYNLGRPNPVKGRRYSKTPPATNEILRCYALAPSLSRAIRGQCKVCGTPPRERHTRDCINPYSERFRALFLICWRAGLRIDCEALRLYDHDLHPEHGYIHVDHGKLGNQRNVYVDSWLWPLLEPWREFRAELSPGPLFCVIEGPTAGVRSWNVHNVRLQLHKLAERAGVTRRLTPHQLRHAMACEQRAEGIDIEVVSRNMGHKSIATTQIYLEGMPESAFSNALRNRPVPQISMLDALRNEGVRLDRHGIPVPPATAIPEHVPTPDLMGALSRAGTSARRPRTSASASRELVSA